MTLAETSTPFDLTVIDFTKGEHKQEAHLRRQPFGRIPAIDDDGFQMYESRAICRYLNDRASGKLVPSDMHERAKMEQWISIETSEFTPNAMKFVYEHIFKRPQEAAVLEAAQKGLTLAASVMDKELEAAPYFAGAEFSLADVTFMPYVEYAMMSPVKELLAKYPHMMAWWNRVSERPTWRKTIGKS